MVAGTYLAIEMTRLQRENEKLEKKLEVKDRALSEAVRILRDVLQQTGYKGYTDAVNQIEKFIEGEGVKS
jgi:hypothetical protein